MKVETYQDAAGLWRWRLLAANGKVMADGAEGYASKRNLRRALLRLERAWTYDETFLLKLRAVADALK